MDSKLKRTDIKVHSPIVKELDDLRVSDLIIKDGGRKRWSLELLGKYFNEEDKDLIITIPLENNSVDDQLIWGFTNDGLYTVKSGYWVAMESRNDEWRSNCIDDDIWKRIWKLEVPGVVRNFAWRGSRGVIPTKKAIKRRINLGTNCCELRSNEAEDILHVVRDCVFAKEAWAHTNLVLPIDCFNATSFRDCIRAILYACDSRKAALCIFFSWRLWGARIDRVRNDTLVDV